MTALRHVETDADLETWVRIKNAVVPNEPTTPEQVRSFVDPDHLLLLAEADGDAVGCGICDRSSFDGRAFIAARVLPDHRRQGIGAAIVRALGAHARALGLVGASGFVYADEPHSIAFAERFGLVEVDYQLEQVRTVGDEPAPPGLDGIEVVALDGSREELLRAVWPVALEGYADMPVPGEITVKLETWLRQEATRPDGSFVALEAGEPVGYAGLMEHADGAATAEHGLTVVRRDRRGRGIARLLKLTQLRWASQAGVVRLVTWTQKGNEAMQALNRSLGYVDTAKVITYHGPLP